jgi:ribosome hibernation promoting factor
MDIQITARHFKVGDQLKEHAINAVEKLERYYDGIVNAEIILSFERSRNSVKVAEIHLMVYGTVLKALEKSNDYVRSLDMAAGKIERQLMKYKGKLHRKEKRTVRRVQEKVS